MTISDPSSFLSSTRTELRSPIALVLFPIRVFVGLGWIRAGVEKIVSRSWIEGRELDTWLALHNDTAIAVMPQLSTGVFDPLSLPISIIVMLTQPLIGLAMLVGGPFLRWALRYAITLNFIFMAFGEILPSAFYIAIELALLTALNTGLIGDDARPGGFRQCWFWAIVAAACIPFIHAMSPGAVADDPAVVIATLAVLAAITEYLRLPIGVDPLGIRKFV